MLGTVARQVLAVGVRADFLKLIPGSSIICVRVRHEGKLGDTPKTREEIERLGLTGYMKKYRQYAQYNYQEWRYPQKSRAIDVSCTRDVVDKYDDEKTGIQSFLDSPRDKLKPTNLDFFHNRNIKKKVKEFHRKRFPAAAQEIYVKTHNLLNTENWTIVKKQETENELDKLVTSHAYPDMIKGLESKTVLWKYNGTIEPPRVVRIRTAAMMERSNVYGQVTVRFHSKQTLAIYDRFGRLMYGNPEKARNVLEYVVFERHISHPYGLWRIHAKIPADSYKKEPMQRTIAVMKPKENRLAAIEWHKAEDEACIYKWYPTRHKVMEKIERMKRLRQGHEYWRRRRKYAVNCIKRVAKQKMRGRVVKLVKLKKEQVEKLRKDGKLPPPPTNRNVTKFP